MSSLNLLIYYIKHILNKNTYIDKINYLLNIKSIDYTIRIITIKPSIIDYIDILNNINKQNLLSEYVIVDDVTINSKDSISINKWLTYKDKIIHNKKEILNKWLVVSKSLLETYNKLTQLQNNTQVNNIIISYNIRRLKPYIINIEFIVDSML